MILGVGSDIVCISRIAHLSDGGMEKFLSPWEKETYLKPDMNKSDYESLAGVFAVKEAVSKAFRISLFELGAKNIEVKKNKNKAPYVVLTSAAEEVIRKHSPCEYYNVHVSIAHEKEYAVAFAIVESV